MPLILDIEPPADCTVRFISDLHLAHKRSTAPSPEALLGLMEGIGMLVLCGDTAETRATCIERERSMELREELRRLCAQRGIQLIELAGNHDPDIEPMMVRLWGGSVVAMHGHAILKEISPWSREYMAAAGRVQQMIQAHPEADHDLTARLELTRSIAQELSQRVPPPTGRQAKRHLLAELYHCFWPPARPLSIVRSWLTCGPRAERWVKRYLPQTRYFIIGHFHRSGRWQYGPRTIFNTSAWFEHAHPCAVDMRNGELLRYHRLHA